jgi:GMP synthase (glutamine-hydrolysing)
MHAVAIRHVAYEDLGAFGPAIERAGYTLRYCDAGVDDLAAIDPLAPDVLVVLGGPIGAHDEALYPFVNDELAILEARIAANRPTLGICLGSQLMARAMGARVYTAPAKEIGFIPLALTEAGRASPLAPYAGEPVLHWHGDTFDLPENTVGLGSTPLCVNQGFARGPNILALQCHPEVGAHGFERWLIGSTQELAHAAIDVVELRAEHQRLAAGLEARAIACIESWLGQLEP